ncbi:MAG: Xanthine and dehydrogenase maturation factor, XdhC/CoxF family [Rhizobacter sp.]|nr:Xanthine and dehydrogenase maturation factor, XdhC/CoxF family [Rhizobacter sp.]
MATNPSSITPGALPDDHSPAAVIAHALAGWDTDGKAALATVVRTWSSAPRRPGSQMAINASGASLGSLAGGTVEAQVVTAALAAMADGEVRTLTLQVDDEQAQGAGMPCGGHVDIRIEPLYEEPFGNVPLLREVLHAIEVRRSVVLCTRLSDANRMLIPVDEPADTELSVEAGRAAAVDTTWVADIEKEPVLFQVFNAPVRLLVVGAVHIAQALVPAARLVGFEVTVIDPRAAFASEQRFPGVPLIVDEPSLALRLAGLDRRCAVIALSHDSEIDDAALIKALRSKAFYVGALGRRKTHKARLKRLHDAKLTPALTARLHGPAGLGIGAIGPAEIAASIVAQVIAVLRGKLDRVEEQLGEAEPAAE